MPPSDSFTIVEGLTTVPSHFAPKETMDRVETEIGERGMNVFARIDHAAGAAEVGLTLRPTELIIFGNARGGTPLMQPNQTVGIDLPLKALVWQDAAGKTLISYNEPSWIALLAIWGKNDPFFIPPGAEAFRRDLPNAKVQFLDTGHFALETHLEEIALAMRDFLGRLPLDEPRSKEVTAVIDEAASLLSRTNVK